MTTNGCSPSSAAIRSPPCSFTARATPPALSTSVPRSKPPPKPLSRVDAQTPEQAAGAQLSKYAFVILSDTGPLPQRLDDEINRYVQNGGSVLITLGKNSVAGAKLPAAGIQVLQIRTLNVDHDHPLTVVPDR